MQLTDEGWCCYRGEMCLAPVTATQLISLIETTPCKSDSSSHFAESLSSDWYCPRCRHQMISDSKGIVRYCNHCSLELPGSLVFQLVEVHPHAKVNKRTDES